MTRPSRFSPEVRERAVRMVVEHEAAHDSQWAAITSIAEKIGCTAETLRKWVRQAERDQGRRPGLTTEERQRLKQLERENFELRRANEILKKAAAFFAQAELDAERNDDAVHRHAPGRIRGRADLRCAVDCPVLYYERRARRHNPERRPQRVRRDERLSRQIQRAWHEEHEVYGARKVWKHLRREGEPVARCTAERLMRQLGLHGVIRGRKFKRTTCPGTAAVRPPDLVTPGSWRRARINCGSPT
jgi:transposase-like protein